MSWAGRTLQTSKAWGRRRVFVSVHDIFAGVTVALVLVPQSLAYAQVAGMPTYRGLYAAALPPLVAAIFASSPYLQTGPVALTSLLTFGALSGLAPPGSDRYVELGAALALVVGAVRLVLGFGRAGVIAYLMSQPVLVGFMPAAALLIVASQLPALLSVAAPSRGILQEAVWALVHPAAWEITAVVLALVTLSLVSLGARVHRLFPGVLCAVIGGIAFSLAADYAGPTVGEIPAGFPPISLGIAWGDLPTLLVAGTVIALVGFAEPAAIARTFAALDRQPWDANREFVSQGAANIAAAFSGSYPVGGSFSRSALNRVAGARTRWSGAVTGLTVLLFLPFASVLASLPRAVLAAIVVGAVIGLVRVRPAIDLIRYSRWQFGIAFVTFGLTLGLAPHVEQAVLSGIVLAVAVHLWRELRLDIDATMHARTLELRPQGVLWFGTSRSLEDRFVALLGTHPNARALVVRLDALGRIDLTGALALRTLVEDARATGLAVTVEQVPAHARPLLGRVLPEACRKQPE